MQNVEGPESLALNDWRLSVAAELVAGGDVLGKAIVLGPKLAVTTLSTATSARTQVATAQRISVTNPGPALGPLVSGPLALMFPQFRTSSGTPPAVSAALESIDEDLRFGVLSLPGTLPRQLPSGLLGTGELPADGARCSVVYADDPEVAFYGLSGQIEQAAEESSFYIYLGALPADHSQLMGAPVFFEDRLIGMVVGGPARSVSGPFIGVTSIRGMAMSDVTPAVRALLPWIPDESAKARESVVASSQFPKNVKDGATRVPSQVAPDSKADLEQGEELPPGWSDAGFLTRLEDSARQTVELAEGMRRASGHNRMRMEHLIGALYGAWSGLFLRRGVKGPDGLNEIFVKAGVAPVEYEASGVALAALPPRVGDVQRAFVAAARMADERGDKPIWDRDLLNGVFSIEGNRVIRALAEMGLTRERIARGSGAVAVKGSDANEVTAEAESTTFPLPEDVDGFATETQTVRATSSKDALEAAVPPPGGYQSKVSEVKESVILDAMKRAQGDAAEAAKILGLHPNYLQRLIRNLGLEGAAKRTGAGEISDEQLWARMTPAARRVFERAMGMVQAEKAVPGIMTPADKRRDNKLHMEFLIAALFESQKESFTNAKIDRSELRRILRQAVGTTIPEDYQSQRLDALPETSEHVGMAIAEADKYATKQRARHINESHLLHGAIRVPDCRVIGALTDAGIRWQNVLTYTDPDDLEAEVGYVSKDQEVDEKPTSAPPVADLQVQTRIVGESGAPTAAPTPKVDSDLWCKADRLGYEAYARTIASLITHKETIAPLTIGIKAPWGAGKTSLMKRVQHLLDGYAELSEGSQIGILQEWQLPKVTLRELLDELTGSSKPTKLEAKRSKEGEAYGLPPRTTVWFNAWKYQTSEQIWAGMAHCIISQVTARMDVKERELFWLRLHARRVNVSEVRHKIYEMVVRQMIPLALGVVAVCAIAFWIAAVVPVGVPWRYVIRGASLVWGWYCMTKEWGNKLGEKAAGTVRELIREPDYEGKMGYLHLVESDIREVLQLATEASMTKEKPGGDPLVVFVDDLDRCAPNKVAEVVEAINLFLCGDYPNCIFVLAMEPGMVAAALEVANKDVIEKAQEMGFTDAAVPVGWRFMEKIVQLPITIPSPTKNGRTSYVESLTGVREWNAAIVRTLTDPNDVAKALVTSINAQSAGIAVPEGSGILEMAQARAAEPKPPSEEDVKRYLVELDGRMLSEVEAKSAKVLAEAPPEKRAAAAEASKRAYAQTFSERDPGIAEFVNRVVDLVDGNPRQIKRYVNVFRFYSTLRHSLRVDGTVPADELPSDEVLAKFVALSIQWPHAVDCLRVKKDSMAGAANGKKVTVLELLESESRKPVTDVAATSAAWQAYVTKLGLGGWAAKRTFREFLAEGESLCQKEGHGLW